MKHIPPEAVGNEEGTSIRIVGKSNLKSKIEELGFDALINRKPIKSLTSKIKNMNIKDTNLKVLRLFKIANYAGIL